MMPQNMLKNPYNAYREQGVMMASPVELIVMLYDGLKKNMLLMKRDIEQKHDPATAHKHCMKAQDIINELLGSLDMSFSLAKDLMSLYAFLLESLVEINASKNAEALDPLIEIVTSLRETWNEVDQNQKRQALDYQEIASGELK